MGGYTSEWDECPTQFCAQDGYPGRSLTLIIREIRVIVVLFPTHHRLFRDPVHQFW